MTGGLARLLFVVVALCSLVLSWVHPAFAEVPLTQTDCPPLWDEPLHKLVVLELNSLVQERPRALLSDIRSVDVKCFDDRVVVTVISAKGKTSRRTISWLDDEAGTVQPRVVALTAAELADSIWLVAPRSPKETPPRPYRRIESAGRRWIVGVGGAVESLGKPSLLGLGAQLSLEHYVFPALAARLEVRPMFASSKRDTTEIRARSLSAVVSAVFGDHAWHKGQRWSWGFGPGLRVGWAQIIGTPTQALTSCPPPGCDLVSDAVYGLWLGPLLTGRVAYILPEAVAFSLNVEGGMVTRPVIGTDYTGAALFGYDGPWLGAGLAIGSAF
jgi:hypothetical protein